MNRLIICELYIVPLVVAAVSKVALRLLLGLQHALDLVGEAMHNHVEYQLAWLWERYWYVGEYIEGGRFFVASEALEC